MTVDEQRTQRLRKQMRETKAAIVSYDASIASIRADIEAFDMALSRRIGETVCRLGEPLREHRAQEEAAAAVVAEFDRRVADYCTGRAPDGHGFMEDCGHLATVEKAARKRSLQSQMLGRLIDAEMTTDDTIDLLDRAIVDAGALVESALARDAEADDYNPAELARDTVAAARELKELCAYLVTTFGLSGHELLRTLQTRVYTEAVKIEAELDSLRPNIERRRHERERVLTSLLAERDTARRRLDTLQRRGEDLRTLYDDIEWRGVRARLSLATLSGRESRAEDGHMGQARLIGPRTLVPDFLGVDAESLFAERDALEERMRTALDGRILAEQTHKRLKNRLSTLARQPRPASDDLRHTA